MSFDKERQAISFQSTPVTPPAKTGSSFWKPARSSVRHPTGCGLHDRPSRRKSCGDTAPPLKVKHFLEVEGYDPRIHAVYFCPQLYKYDPDKKLVPLQGDEIGKLIAQALASGVKERRPWYEPSEKLPNQPIINSPADEFDTLVVEMPSPRTANDKKPMAVVENRD